MAAITRTPPGPARLRLDDRPRLRASADGLPAHVPLDDLHVVRDARAVPGGDGPRARVVRRQRRLGGPRRDLLPRVPRARAARGGSDELGVLRGGLPGHERARVEPDLPRDVRHADLAARHHAGQPAVHRGAPDADRDGLHAGHRRCSGRPRRALVVLAIPAACPDRHGVRGADRGVHGDPEDPDLLQRPVPLRHHAAVPVLRHVLPGLLAAAVPPADRLADAAVPRGVADPRALARDDLRRPAPGGRQRPRSWSSSWSSGRGSRSGRSVDGWCADDRPPPHADVHVRQPSLAKLIERNLYVYKHGWMVILRGFFEPLFYLLGIGFGIGRAGRAGRRARRPGDHVPAVRRARAARQLGDERRDPGGARSTSSSS